MKAISKIQEARGVVVRAMTAKGLSEQQKILLTGMSVALQWVMDEGGATLQMLIDGEPVEAGKVLNTDEMYNLAAAVDKLRRWQRAFGGTLEQCEALA